MFETQTSRQKKSKIAGAASAAVKLRGDQAILLVAASEGDANMLVRDNQLLLPYNSPHLSAYPEGSKDKAPGGLFYTTVDRESYAGIGYNRNAIPSADVPKSFDDLLRPSLKGKIGISNEEIATRVIGAMPDGALLVSDDEAGAIYRISYKK